MSDLTQLEAELRAKEKIRDYHLDLLRHDPFNWSHRLTVQSLEAEIQELKKAVCVVVMEMELFG